MNGMKNRLMALAAILLPFFTSTSALAVSNPMTGDDDWIFILIGVAVVAAAAIIFLVVTGKKKK